MLKSIYHDSRKFLTRLRDELAPPKRVLLRLPSERELFDALATGRSSVLAGAKAAYTSGDRPSAVSLLTGYFHSREGPGFFASSEQILDGVAELERSRPEWVSGTLAHADRLTEGQLTVYAQKAQLAGPKDWVEAPTGPGKDMLYRYRPHRFGFAPRLALAVLYGHENALGALEKLIADWELSVQPDAEPAREYRTFKTSSHVALYRSVAATWVLAFLGAANRGSEELEMTCLRIILGDARTINDSLPGTTPNNHLIADGFGAWYFGSLYPEFAEAETWKSNGTAVFHDQLLRQIYPDGTSFEQSVHYQEHVCEMGVAYLTLCRKNGWQLEDEIADRIRAMLHFQASLTDADGASFSIGDATEDPLFPLDSEDAWCGAALRAMYGELFGGSGTPTAQTTPQLERSFWLLGARFPKQELLGETEHFGISCYPMGGYAVLRARSGRDRLLFRTGPPPDITITCGHMHFDFLSIYLVIDGVPVIVPSGTYTYRASPPGWAWKYGKWREYFMSARAANGLFFSGSDPLERAGGDFPGGNTGDIACRVVTSREVSGNSLIWISALVVGHGEHAGWTRSILQLRDEYWLVIDEYCHRDNSTPGCFGFQFPAGASVKVADKHTIQANVGGAGLTLIFSTGVEQPSCLEGSTRPAGGWISSAYGHLAAAPQLIAQRQSTTTISACLLARTGIAETAPPQLTIGREESEITASVLRNDVEDQFKIKAAAGSSALKNITWIRRNNGRIVEQESI